MSLVCTSPRAWWIYTLTLGHGGAPLNWFAPDARAHTEPLGIPADIALQSGVTTIVDAGSAGAETFLQEKEEVIDKAKVRVLAFLNIVGNGMNGGLEQTVDQMDVKQCAATIRQYPDVIVGVKTAHYWTDMPMGCSTSTLGSRGSR